MSQISEKERSGIELMAELYKAEERVRGEPNQREGAKSTRLKVRMYKNRQQLIIIAVENDFVCFVRQVLYCIK